MVFEPISALEDTLAQVAIIVMSATLLHVVLQGDLTPKPDRTHTTPVLMGIVGLVLR
jgi:hypothetical protein